MGKLQASLIPENWVGTYGRVTKEERGEATIMEFHKKAINATIQGVPGLRTVGNA